MLYAQMLVLFAPQAVATAAHVPLLTATLRASQPALRHAAAATLRHLAGMLCCCQRLSLFLRWLFHSVPLALFTRCKPLAAPGESSAICPSS